MPFRYPPVRIDPLVDMLHGVPVPDPYRWLEDPDSPETQAWVEAQNALTRSVLDGPGREALAAELTKLFDYPRTSIPQRRGYRYFFSHNPGLLNQPLLYVQDGPDGAPRVLVDPNRLSEDATTALTAWQPSPDGTLVAYAVSVHGSDRQVIRIRRVADASDLPDRLQWVKFASIAWTRDATGFYYLRFPEPGTVPAEDEQYFGRIYFHRVGGEQQQDTLIFERPAQKEVVPLVHVTADDRYAVITAQRGASDDSEVYLVDRGAGGGPVPLFTGFEAAYDFIETADGHLYFRTTQEAPRGRIVAVDPRASRPVSRTIVPESEHRLSLAVMSAGALAVVYLANASDRILRFDLAGAPLGEIGLPGIGSITTIDAEPDGDEILFTYTSFTDAPQAWVFREGGAFRLKAEATRAEQASAEATQGGSSVVRHAPAADVVLTQGPGPSTSPRGFRLQADDPRYETRQVWYRSKDGTPVSMFLVHRADLPRDGARPVLLSGYGGFNISRTPAYDPGNFPLLARGGVFALANLRGGGEYGEDWHRAGMLERKQNVFDDFIAAAEYLIAEGYTRPERLTIEGGSNGGLLVGAVMTQRPELFGTVLCRVPVADMLRYHLFTIGRFWIPEYGSAEDPAQFPYLLQYSPYHNVRDAVRYPRTLIMTADTDDRVSPGMAKKFAARLQAAGRGGPILIRVETKAGHGAGKPLAKVIDEEADMLAFLGVDDPAPFAPARPVSSSG